MAKVILLRPPTNQLLQSIHGIRHFAESQSILGVCVAFGLDGYGRLHFAAILVVRSLGSNFHHRTCFSQSDVQYVEDHLKMSRKFRERYNR